MIEWLKRLIFGSERGCPKCGHDRVLYSLPKYCTGLTPGLTCGLKEARLSEHLDCSWWCPICKYGESFSKPCVGATKP